MNLAPIALFVYNRPKHTYRTLKALESADLSIYSDLYIFCDGPKKADDLVNINLINDVVEICKKKYSFRSVNLIQNEINKGLSKNIISGINFVLQKHDRIIVLEDDILVSIGFLKFMNDSLNLYEYESKVGCIHGWNYPLNTKNIQDETFFLYGADCWGWATWRRAWDKFELDGSRLLEEIIKANSEYDFNRRNTIDYIQMLKNQISGNNDSWAIKWHASLFIENMYCLHPVKSMVINIGLDSTGSNFGSSSIRQKQNSYTVVNPIKIEDSEWFHNEFQNKTTEYFFTQSFYQVKKRKLKEFLYKLLHKT
jgi:hypothetical protein